MSTRSKGTKGEEEAAWFLEKNGCRILGRNYFIRGGEVDIIFADGGQTVFCEVKLRTQDRYGTPAESVTIKKRKRICKAALDYAYQNKKVDENYRFDIIEIYNGKINHIKNAFEFIEPLGCRRTMRKITCLLIIILLISCLFVGTALADETKPSKATAAETILATVLTVIITALFIVVCVMLVLRIGLNGKGIDGRTWPILLLVIVFAILIRAIVAMAFEGYATDVACFKGWAITAYEYGPAGFYTSGVYADYPPGYMYILYVLGWIRDVFNIDAMGALFTLIVKLPSIVAEVVLAVFIYKTASRQIGKTFGLLCAAFLLFNPAMFFNSSVWGQIDAVFILFIVLTLSHLKKENYLMGALFFSIAFLIKPQAVLFLPVVGLAYFYAVFKKGGLKKALVGIFGGAVVTAAVFFAMVLPFTGNQDIGWIFEKYKSTIAFYQYASLDAFNLFALVGANFVDSTQPFLMMTYSQWGTIFIALICVTVIFLQWKTRQHRPLFDLAAFLVISVFMLAHSMHERYILPALACLIFAYVYSRDPVTLFFAAAFSITALFNEMIVLYSDSVMTPALPTLIFSAINIALFAAYAVVTIKKLSSGKVLIKTPAMSS